MNWIGDEVILYQTLKSNIIEVYFPSLKFRGSAENHKPFTQGSWGCQDMKALITLPSCPTLRGQF